MAPILLVGGILLTIIGLYWAVTASVYICFGGLACQSSYNAWMLERTLGSSSLFIGIGLLAVGTYMWFKVRPSTMEKSEQLPFSTDSTCLTLLNRRTTPILNRANRSAYNLGLPI